MPIHRRRFIARTLAGAVALSPLRFAQAAGSEPLCALTPEQERGAFYLPNQKMRSDLIEDRPGVQLAIRIRIVAADDCTAIKGATVEIWSADANGQYSGFDIAPSAAADAGTSPAPSPSNDKTFLRGMQVSNDDGIVEFATLFPGCYDGRLNHIHALVHTVGRDGKTRLTHTGQIFFPGIVTNDVLAAEPYKSNPVARTLFNKDPVYQNQNGAASLCKVAAVKDKNLREGLDSIISFSVDPNVTPQPVGAGTRA